jgi:hypothetical protein
VFGLVVIDEPTDDHDELSWKNAIANKFLLTPSRART